MRLQKEERVLKHCRRQIQMAKIRVTQIKSPIGRNSTQRKTLISMGLNKISRVKELDDNSSNRGMVEKVKHLLKIENI